MFLQHSSSRFSLAANKLALPLQTVYCRLYLGIFFIWSRNQSVKLFARDLTRDKSDFWCQIFDVLPCEHTVWVVILLNASGPELGFNLFWSVNLNQAKNAEFQLSRKIIGWIILWFSSNWLMCWMLFLFQVMLWYLIEIIFFQIIFMQNIKTNIRFAIWFDWNFGVTQVAQNVDRLRAWFCCWTFSPFNPSF